MRNANGQQIDVNEVVNKVSLWNRSILLRNYYALEKDPQSENSEMKYDSLWILFANSSPFTSNPGAKSEWI